MKKMVFLITILMASACAPYPGSNANLPGEQLNAENRLMKNNLDLALRENEVIKEENKQYKTKTANLNSEIQRLNEVTTGLKRKYTIDMAMMTDRYNTLQDQYNLLQTTSDSKIMELAAQNLELDRRMKNEISSLNSKMEIQKASFEKARQSQTQNFAAKKKEFETELASIKQTLAEKETVIASMKAANDQSQLQIDKLLQEIDSYKAELDRMNEENRGSMQSNQSLPEAGTANREEPSSTNTTIK